MDPEHLLLLLLFFFIAFMYSSIGHGGASGYLALMALYSFEPNIMKGSALILNILVAGISFYLYLKNDHFKWKLFWPFAITSIPFAFAGGMLTVDPILYKRILGIFLLFAIMRILFIKENEKNSYREVNIIVPLLFGCIIGFFSGLIGIGGGIILSPLILLLYRANIKQTAAISSLFILTNSVAGLGGMAYMGFDFYPKIYIWIAAAFGGGLLGAYLGAKKFENKLLKYILSIVLGLASIKLFLI